MAWESPLQFDGSRTALENLSSAKAQFLVVKTTAATTFKRQTSAAGVVYGVLQDTPTSGTQGSIMIAGITKVRVNSTAHTAVAVLDKLVASTKAGVIPATTAAGTYVTKYVIGRALDTLSSNSTGIITMLITREGGGSSGTQSQP